MSRAEEADRWTVTHAHLRGVVFCVVGIVAALVLQRSDLLVLICPVLIVLVWSALQRPATSPSRRFQLTRRVLGEGERGHAVFHIEHVPGAEVLAVSVADTDHVDFRPAHGSAVHVLDESDAEAGEARVAIGVDPQRWGVRRVGPSLVGALSSWGSYRWGPVPLPEQWVRALPQATGFDASAPAPHPRGLVGLHRSVRPGEGSEFRSIRPFQWGDRLKRIHWARSLRTGELHVTSSHADQDTHVAIVVDAHYDLGSSGGLKGSPSSMDHTVRAAGAISAHFLHQGDRVSLQVWSGRTPVRVRAGSGRRHHRRILETLSLVATGPQDEPDPRQLRRGLGVGALVVMVSALVSPMALSHAAALARSGVSVVVVDVLVDDVAPPGEAEPIGLLAWRIRMLERDAEVRRIQHEGVPVVPWRGHGSLDEVLRSLARRGQRGRVG